MYFIKIDVPGWEHFNGLLGMVPFENGISTRHVTPQEAARIGSTLRVVEVGTDEQVGASVNMATARNISAEVTPLLQRATEEEVAVIEPKYTKDELEEIASEGGIKAVREIAKEFDVKGIEINKIIDEIMKVQLGTKEEN